MMLTTSGGELRNHSCGLNVKMSLFLKQENFAKMSTRKLQKNII